MADNKVSVELTIEEQQALKALTALTGKLDKMGDTAEKSGKKASKSMSEFRNTMKGFLAANLIGKMTGRLSQGFGDAIDSVLAFETAITEINTIMPKNTKLTEANIAAIEALGLQFGTTAAEQAKSYYQIVSAGTIDAAEATNLLSSANKLAIGGLSDVGSSINVLTDIINVYGKENITAEDAADALFKTVQLGKTNISDLASSLGGVIPLASNAGVSLDEASAALATLTTQGLSTAENVTQLKALFSAVAKNSSKLGAGFDLTALKAKGLAQFVGDLAEKTGGSSTELFNLLGRGEAVQAVLRLTGKQFKTLNNNIDQFTDKTGAANKAFKQFENTTEFQLKKLKAGADGIGRSLLETFLPAVGFATKAINKFLNPPDISTLKAIRDDIKETRINIEELTEKQKMYSNLKGQSPAFKKTLEETEKSLDSQKKKLELLIKTRNEFSKPKDANKKPTSDKDDATDGSGDDNGKTEADKAGEKERLKNEAILREKRNLDLQLELIEQEALAKKTEKELATEELTQEQRQLKMEKLAEFEKNKANIIFQQEKLRAETLQSKEAKETAIKTAGVKQRIALDKAESDSAQKKADLEQQIFNVRLQALQGYLSAGASLAKKGSDAQKAIQIANSIISTYSAATQALATPPGPPYTIPLAGAVVAQGLANVNRIANQSFQSGGVVNGFSGATNGSDNTTANVRTGEMILNANQQKELFSIAQGNGADSGSNSAVEAMASQPIVVAIDGREIARTVRDQKKEGFKI